MQNLRTRHRQELRTLAVAALFLAIAAAFPILAALHTRHAAAQAVGITISPTHKVAGDATFFLEVKGEGVNENGIVLWNDQELQTEFFEDALIATVPNSLIASRVPNNTATITVVSLAGTPGGRAPLDIAQATFTIDRSSSDVNCSGNADAADALFLLRVLAGLQQAHATCSANADKSGAVDVSDVMHIRKEVGGIVPLSGPLPSDTQP